MPPTFSETDLYAPVAAYLRAQGYAVHSEVEHCDITAVKDGELVVIELKRAFTTGLLVQATRRQRIADSVYVALPRPKWSRTWQGLQHVLRRLELGLILVTLGGEEPQVEVVFHPLPFERKKQRRKRRAVLREIANRSGDFNQGGSTRRKLMTAYRENALQIACCLERFGSLSPKQLREFGTGPKTYSILTRNVYKWFDRVGPAEFVLRPVGREEMALYEPVISRCRDWVQTLVPATEPAQPAPPRVAERTRTAKAKQEKPAASPNKKARKRPKGK